MGQHPHYFIAIPLPVKIKHSLSKWQHQLKMDPLVAYKQWTHVDDLHITLKFLGGVHDRLLSDLLAKLQPLHSISSFDLEGSSIGTFGNERQPRVLWAGVHMQEQLNQLQTSVEDVCVDVGFPREKRVYRPHITLAKKWNGTSLDPQYISLVSKNYEETWTATIDSIVVYQIHPSQSPKYEVIKTIQLKS